MFIRSRHARRAAPLATLCGLLLIPWGARAQVGLPPLGAGAPQSSGASAPQSSGASALLRWSLGAGPATVWRVSDGYELFHAGRVGVPIDLIGAVDIVRVHTRWEFALSAGYRYDWMSRRYALTLGTSLVSHDASVGATVRWAVRPWLAPFVRAEAVLSTHVVQLLPEQGAQLGGTAFAGGGLASIGLMLRTGALLSADSAVNFGLFASFEAGARLVTDAPIVVRSDPPSDPRIAAEALPVTEVTVSKLNASTPFLRASVGVRF
ncbi:MAG: hypothetical protein Q8Q09_01460 [Deltaproteobacteria bacterium]|nr:hypothetical protein [Deltaproteobacteria bacterium]